MFKLCAEATHLLHGRVVARAQAEADVGELLEVVGLHHGEEGVHPAGPRAPQHSLPPALGRAVTGGQALDGNSPERQTTVTSTTGHVPWRPSSCGGGGAQGEQLHQLGGERGKVHQDALLRLCRRRG